MESRLSGFEKAISCKSLVCLIQALVGEVTTVELRSEAVVYGTVSSVDAFMNVSLTKAIFTDPAGRSSRFDSFFVHGRQIRYVQIPDQVSPIEAIRRQLNCDQGKRREQQAVLGSLRRRRANAYHLQTVQSLAVSSHQSQPPHQTRTSHQPQHTQKSQQPQKPPQSQHVSEKDEFV